MAIVITKQKKNQNVSQNYDSLEDACPMHMYAKSYKNIARFLTGCNFSLYEIWVIQWKKKQFCFGNIELKVCKENIFFE